ncbi:MAG: hypothetical protein GY694_06945 [Gammaproteobacteria bacterium]|nr:hypothetical protein [Gammaproteobacteria bacterium]
MTSSNTIADVSPSTLRDAVDNKQIDDSSQKLKEAEEQYINAWKEQNGRSEEDGITGLALSGGGIRSATFSLGVMQALAKHNKLGRFDYLSTVSGGGYIGSAITWLLNEKKRSGQYTYGVGSKCFPYGTDAPENEPCDGKAEASTSSAQDDKVCESEPDQRTQATLLEFVRQRASYLNPGKGISILALLGAILRGVFLNLMVWLPVIIFFFMLLMWGSRGISYDPFMLTSGVDFLFSQNIPQAVSDSMKYLHVFELMITLGLGGTALLFLLLIRYSFYTYKSRNLSSNKMDKHYDLRFKVEKIVPIVMITVVVLLIIGSIPLVGLYFQEQSSAIGPIAALGGSAFMLRYFIGTMKKVDLPLGVSVNLGATLFIYSILLISFQTGLFLVGLLHNGDSAYLGFGLALILVLSLSMGHFVNLNYISLHRFYRDRLMETFMPDMAKVSNEDSQHHAATRANKAYVKNFSSKYSKPNAPYHIVNTNLVLANAKEYSYCYRGGDNFILSPLYCGSNATGWCQTEDFMDGKMTLATAVAISGAAVNPNTGVGGDGITRSTLLSFVMSFLNLRLGYWAHHPIKKPSFLMKIPNHFKPGSYALGHLLGIGGRSKDRPYIQLSDGGHFENTGIYELVRRRAKLILACDGGEDHAFSFSDFQTTVRRIEDDFGARVTVDDTYSVNDVVPLKQDPRKYKDDLSYPPEAELAERGFILATITYPDDTEGQLIYLKTTMQKEVSFKVKGYKAKNPQFPDQSTGDQFFDEVQFEAYRELGFSIASKMIRDLGDTVKHF